MDELPTPITRSEKFLAKAAGEDVSLPEPITREEIYLNAIANNGGGGGSDLPPVTSADNGAVLEVLDGAWGKGNKGYGVEETTITTEIYSSNSVKTNSNGEANISGFDNAPAVGDVLAVVWNGTPYSCECTDFQGEAVKLGATSIIETGTPDWSEYPFCLILPLVTSGGGVVISNAKNATISLDISKTTTAETVTTTEEFAKAVEAVSGILVVNVEWNDSANAYVADKTLAEVCAAMNDKKPVAIGLGTYDGYSFALAYNEDGNGITEIQWLETYINSGVPTIVNYVWTIADGIYEDGTYSLSTTP